MDRIVLYFITSIMFLFGCHQEEAKLVKKNSKLYPNDYFFRQRAFPSGEINMEAYKNAVQQADILKQQESRIQDNWESVGPINIGGRISALAMHASNQNVIYAGSASGGVFKSADQGATWQPIFDDQPSLSIGDVAIAPSNPNVIYAGTGESNAGGGSMTYDGFGIYRSDNAGISWTGLGLEEGRNTGRLAIHPTNEDVVYAAMMGNLFGDNSERGIYKTMDGGVTWDHVLFVSDSTGGADLAIHPTNPDTVYAATWERIRRPDRRSYGGETSAIYRTYDGGANWTELTNGLPSLPSQKGRIGITISNSNPENVYAIYADQSGDFEGVFRSSDHGNTWATLNGGPIAANYSSFGWWFGRITVHPTNPDEIYTLGLDVERSTNGGNSWVTVGGSNHVDQHAYYIHPVNTNLHVSGNDGGIYISLNAGSSWSHVENLS